MSKKTSDALAKSELVALYRQALVSGVPLTKVEHKVSAMWQRTQVSEDIEATQEKTRTQQLQDRLPKFMRLGALALPLGMIILGLSLVGSAVVPILAYYVSELPQLQANDLTTPVPADRVLDVNPVVITKMINPAEQAAQLVTEPTILEGPLDYTNLSNWFNTNSPELLSAQTAAQTYMLDIPTINVHGATVTVGGSNLNKSLIQFPGTALPGDPGSPVIFGHSVLRQFYNPSEKNPRRYNSIFSTIMTLKKGDHIFVTFGDVKYTYIVQDKTEVKPEDTFILAQKYDTKQLKLVTCTPEGTYLRRGVITAVLATE